jgi:putative oxidoreductase
MTAAVLTVHVRQGFFATNNGYEYNLVLVAAAFALAGTGPGKWSLDNALHIDLSGTSWALGALGAGVLAGLATVAVGRLGAARGTDHGQPDAA